MPSNGFITQVKGAPEANDRNGARANKYGAASAATAANNRAIKTPIHGFGSSDSPLTMAGVAINPMIPVPTAKETA
jgi:hypothetical protein